MSLQYLSRSSLHRLAGLPCRLFLSHGLQVVTREVHRSSLRPLIGRRNNISHRDSYNIQGCGRSMLQMQQKLSRMIVVTLQLSIISVTSLLTFERAVSEESNCLQAHSKTIDELFELL